MGLGFEWARETCCKPLGWAVVFGVLGAKGSGGRPLTAPPFNTVQPHPSCGPANPVGPPDLTAALESRAVNFCSQIRAQTLRLREGSGLPQGSQRRSEAGTRVFPAPPALQGAPRSPPSPRPRGVESLPDGWDGCSALGRRRNYPLPGTLAFNRFSGAGLEKPPRDSPARLGAKP